MLPSLLMTLAGTAGVLQLGLRMRIASAGGVLAASAKDLFSPDGIDGPNRNGRLSAAAAGADAGAEAAFAETLSSW